MAKKSSKKGLVAKSFPEMGNMMPAHLGSQSDPPNKMDPYIDTVQNSIGAPPMGGQY